MNFILENLQVTDFVGGVVKQTPKPGLVLTRLKSSFITQTVIALQQFSRFQ